MPFASNGVQAVASMCGVSAMPTFQVWVNGAKVDEMVGAVKEKLEKLVEKYASPVPA
jgi:thioredoxin 1